MKQLVINLTVLLLAVCLSLGVGEILLRVLYRRPIKHWEDKHNLFCEYDSLLGWKKIPNKRGRCNTDEYSVVQSFNSKGLRGLEYSYDKADNEYRILVLGDSFAHGYTVEFKQLFSEVLKNILNNTRKAGGRYYEVINSGTGGWSTDQELLFFQTEGKKYSPDLAILMLSSNDVWYNNQPKYWRGYKPLFRLEAGRLVLTNVPVPKLHGPMQSDGCRVGRISIFDRAKAWLGQKSSLYNMARDSIKNTYWLHILAIKLRLAKHDCCGLVTVPDEFRVWKKTYDVAVRDAWEVTEAILIKLREEVEYVGGELVVFYIPPRPSVYKEVWQDTKKRYGLSDKEWNPDQVGREITAVCQRNGIDFIDPTTVFRAEAKALMTKRKQLHFVRDGHWNPGGHRLVGEILSEYMSRTSRL